MKDQSPYLKLVIRIYVHFSILRLIISQLSDSGIFSYMSAYILPYRKFGIHEVLDGFIKGSQEKNI